MSAVFDIGPIYESKFFPRLPIERIRRARRKRLLDEAEQRGYERGLEDAKRRFAVENYYMPTMREIAEEVAVKHGLRSWKVLRSHRRNRPLVTAKHELWWRCQEETHHTVTAIARFFGFDHTTILHGAREHEKRFGALAEKVAA